MRVRSVLQSKTKGDETPTLNTKIWHKVEINVQIFTLLLLLSAINQSIYFPSTYSVELLPACAVVLTASERVHCFTHYPFLGCSWWLRDSKNQQGSMFTNPLTLTILPLCTRPLPTQSAHPSPLSIPLLISHSLTVQGHTSHSVTRSLNKCQPWGGAPTTMCKHHVHTHSNWGGVYYVVCVWVFTKRQADLTVSQFK